eukprot:14037238-Alexandrium_andersonii.AAC.1
MSTSAVPARGWHDERRHTPITCRGQRMRMPADPRACLLALHSQQPRAWHAGRHVCPGCSRSLAHPRA